MALRRNLRLYYEMPVIDHNWYHWVNSALVAWVSLHWMDWQWGCRGLVQIYKVVDNTKRSGTTTKDSSRIGQIRNEAARPTNTNSTIAKGDFPSQYVQVRRTVTQSIVSLSIQYTETWDEYPGTTNWEGTWKEFITKTCIGTSLVISWLITEDYDP